MHHDITSIKFSGSEGNQETLINHEPSANGHRTPPAADPTNSKPDDFDMSILSRAIILTFRQSTTVSEHVFYYI